MGGGGGGGGGGGPGVAAGTELAWATVPIAEGTDLGGEVGLELGWDIRLVVVMTAGWYSG